MTTEEQKEKKGRTIGFIIGAIVLLIAAYFYIKAVNSPDTETTD